MKNKLSIFLVFFVLATFIGCTPTPEIPQTSTPEVVPTSELQPTNEPQPTSEPAPVFALWSFYDLQDPTRPSILLPSNETFYIDPSWQLETVEYLGQWWGLGEPGLDSQRLDRLANSDDFVINGRPVDAVLIQELLDSLTQLYPVNSLLGGNAWTDDYPSWLIELTGTDGQRVLMFASSTGNVGNGPWVLLINGQLYAQYNGAVAKPLGQLFETRLGQENDVFDSPEDEISFSSLGWPAQLQGFYGLVPIAEGFRYGASWEEGTLVGLIEGRSSIGGFGMMVIGTIDRLNRVEIQASGSETIACTIEDIADTTQDPAAAVWQFSCPVDNLVQGQPYRYDIEVEFGTEDGDFVTTTGQLWGEWHLEDSRLDLHAPWQIEEAILANEKARDIWQTNYLLGLSYSAQINPNDPNEGIWSGEAAFAGEAEMLGQMIRYTISTPFAVEDGQLTYWNLTAETVQQMLDRIEATSLLTEAIALSPDLTLNLFYEESGNLPEAGRFLVGNVTREYEISLAACGSFPSDNFPSVDQPLEAFSLNMGWFFWKPQFLLTSEGVRVADIDLYPGHRDEGGLLPLLQPDVFDTGDKLPFERIWWQSKDFFGNKAELTLWIPEEADEVALETYNNIVDALPVPVSQEYDTLWQASDLGFYLTDNGNVEIMSCQSNEN